MRIPSLAVLAGAALALVSTPGCRSRERVDFAPYEHGAFEAARAAKRPIVIYVTADWCSACKKQERGALSEPAVRTALEPFTRLKLDATNYKTDKQVTSQLVALKVEAFPTLIFIDPHGAELPFLKGNQTPEAIVETAKKAAES
jgi:thiol:disulfide interchange protein DsbD